MSMLVFDLRQSLRSLVKTPTFTVLAVLMLALGIGANTAIFSVVHHFLLARLPYPDADRMVQAYVQEEDGLRGDSFSPANFLDLERQSRSFEALAGYGRSLTTLTDVGEPERVSAASVSPDIFGVLGVRPVRGQGFSDELGKGEVVLSHGFWQRRFDGDPSLLGTSLTLDGESYEVVGILPDGFEPVGLSEFDAWMREPHGVPDPPFEDTGNVREARGLSYFQVLGRLAPGVSYEQALQDVDAVGRRLAEAYPEQNMDESFTLRPFRDVAVEELRPALLTLLVAVALVLFIACVNVAGLMLTRASARERELAVCAALGASRGRLLARMGLEGLVLGIAGGLLGLALGWAALRFLLPFAPESLFRLGEIQLSAPVLAFTFGVSLLSVVVFALVPALRSSRPELQETLKESAGRTTDSAGNRRLRSGLVVGQIALALLMLVGAGLLLRSFLEVTGQPPGFDPEGILTGSVVLPQARYPEPAQQNRFFAEAVNQVERLPNVDSAAAVLTVPFGSSSVSLSFHREDLPPPEPGRAPVAGVNVTTAGYFETLGIPLLGGRTFAESDHMEAPQVAVVNMEMARQFFDGENPVGRRLTFADHGDPDLEWVTVVGLVGDVRHEGFENPIRPEIYLPYSQNPWRFATFLIRTASGDPMDLAPQVRETILGVDRLQPVDSFTTLAETVHGSLAERRFLLLLIGVFAGLALLLATLGLYGIVSHLVTQRTREIGVRMALGADRSRMLLSVVGRGLTLTTVGVVVGLAAALALVRGLESLLYGVQPFDPLAFTAVCLVLLVAASAAAFVPARRAASVDPAVALKGE